MKTRPFGAINEHTLYLRALHDASVVLDLGSNRGAFCRHLKQRVGGRFHLVEANPALFARLDPTEWSVLFHCAVAAEDGAIRFHTALNDEGSSILPLPAESAYGCTAIDSVEIPARTLRSLLAEMGAERIDLLKIDIEGAEVAVLEAIAESDLAKIAQMSVEFHCDPLFPFGLNDRIEQVIRNLEGRGFLCIDFTAEVGWSRRDVLFLNRQALGISKPQAHWWKLTLSTQVAFRRLWRRIRFALRPIRRCFDSFLDPRRRSAAQRGADL